MAVTSVLRPKHHELINLHFLGKTYKQIGEITGMSPGAIYCIIQSPLAQAELAQMMKRAKDSVTNVPLRASLAEQLDRSARKSLDVVERILDNPMHDVKVRARVSQHILDRVVFEKNDNEKEGSYRDILRKLDEMSQNIMIKPQSIVLEHDPQPRGGVAGEQVQESSTELPIAVNGGGNGGRMKILMDEDDV